MSIPPLVCSTPPPPDQCEDDKDPEDFDLSYSLSQEDEDYENNDYTYGGFTTYNHFQSEPDANLQDIKEHEIKKNTKSVLPNELVIKYENIEGLEDNITTHTVIGTSDINENKLRCEDDINIEDLNLKVDKEVESIVENNIEQTEVTDQNIDIEKDFNIPCNTNIDSPICYTNTSPFDESSIGDCNVPKEINSNLFTPLPVKPTDIHDEVELESKLTDAGIPDNSLNSVKLEETLIKSSVNLEETLIESVDTEDTEQISLKLEENVVIDDDFEDFQSVNIESNITNVVQNDNPWQNTESNDSAFGDFRANFEEINFQSANLPLEYSVDASSKSELYESETKEIEDIQNLHDTDDFDDFQSSSVIAMSTESRKNSQCNELPVLNLQSIENEHQIMDRIAKVLSSVFLEEITEPEVDFDGKLETHLSETWGYLKETDERQPYIVNWNNSFGQKTLLKALCIDSRNILFGPKWSSNMPKYAANLSNAPLQPQKQVSVPSIVTQNETVTSKTSDNSLSWRDPFTSDGQESCNTENESAAITPGPTDLDVFEATTKPDKIFSTTMGVQPLRQINLPDTHIFTPTDSEIPRSKTIHYDRGPPVHLQSAKDIENEPNTQSSLNTDRIIENNNEIEDTEHWEFQNFKSSDASSVQDDLNNSIAISQGRQHEIATTADALPQPSIAYQTELLQPIKVEPVIPTLNWPDPGEVKDVFDDFSDFVSTSSQPTKQQNNDTSPTETLPSTGKINTTTISARIAPESNVANKACNHDDFDDDFDTFQSALPSKTVNDIMVNLNKISSPELVSRAHKVDSIRSDISFTHIPKNDEVLTQRVGHINTKELNTSKSLLPLGNLLQPTPASSTINTRTQQKSGQILQPLSLESYSQINWPSPGIDLQDLSRFNPVETLHSLKSDVSVSGPNKGASPVHTNQAADDDVWGDFVSSKPKLSQPKKPSTFVDDDEWTDFISSPSVQPQNGLNTISLNVYTNSNIHKSVQNKLAKKSNQPPIDIPTLNYITPKSNHHKSYNDKHFQNL